VFVQTRRLGAYVRGKARRDGDCVRELVGQTDFEPATLRLTATSYTCFRPEFWVGCSQLRAYTLREPAFCQWQELKDALNVTPVSKKGTKGASLEYTSKTGYNPPCGSKTGSLRLSGMQISGIYRSQSDNGSVKLV
jgi:hypothetical protein